MAGTALVAWATHFTRVGWGTVAFSAVLAALIWAVDLASTLLGARFSGASRWAVAGAGIGVVVGLFFGLPGGSSVRRPAPSP